jgi:hypothetical protein
MIIFPRPSPKFAAIFSASSLVALPENILTFCSISLITIALLQIVYKGIKLTIIYIHPPRNQRNKAGKKKSISFGDIKVFLLL